MLSKRLIFPIFTTVSNVPETICMPIDDRAFQYPFFNQGVSELHKNSESLGNFSLNDIQTSGQNQRLNVKGIVCHTSHCGSTALVRVLNSYPGLRVVSESEAINGLLLSYALCDITEEQTLIQLQSIIEAYRQAAGIEKSVILKLTSWNVWFMDLFQKLYPQCNWLFLDRDTDEVVRSLLRSGNGMVSWWYHLGGNLRSCFIEEGVEYKTKEDFLKQLVIGHKKMSLRHQNNRMLKLRYPDFLKQLEMINAHFNLEVSKDQLSIAMEQLKYDSKSLHKEKFVSPEV